MKLSPEKKELLEQLTVLLLLELRRAYLQTPGCSVLKHWDQLQSRSLAAAKMAQDPGEWATQVMRRLQIQSPGKWLSLRLLELQSEVTALGSGGPGAWLDLVEREVGYLFARCREEAEKRKDRREEEDAAEAKGVTP